MANDVSVGIGADDSQILRVIEESKTAMSEFFATVTEEGAGLGEMLEGIQGKFAAAFNFVGITAGIEAIKQIGETIEHIGQQANELKTVADVLGVTTDQLQAMQEAAEHAGVSSETLTHAGEHLVSILTEARGGSSAAADKLLLLGVSAEQINDPMFKLNDLLQVLHDRLTNPLTAAGEMNELLLVLGNRAGLAAEALKKYDGSAESVKEAMDAMNGKSKEQIDELGALGISWAEFSTKVENSMQKAMLSAAHFGDWLRDHNATLAALSSAVGAPQPQAKTGAFNSVAEATKDAEQMTQIASNLAASMIAQDAKANEKELAGLKANVEAFEQGSAQKLAALQKERDFAAQMYGSDQFDKVKAIDAQIIAEKRAYFDAQIAQSKAAERAEDERVSKTLSGIAAMIDADGRYLEKQVQDQKTLDGLSDYAQELVTRTHNQKTQALNQEMALNTKVTNEFYQKWAGVSGAVSSSFSSALSGMLAGTESFGDGVRGVFSSITNSLIQMIVNMGVQWAEGLIAQQVIQKSTAMAGSASNAALYATAAMASVAAIPIAGWAMAPEVGAAAYAEGMAYAASASAAGGYDIPSGINPVTQLHAEEMVLPAPIANSVRDMASGGGRGGTVNLHAQAATGDHVLVTRGNLAAMVKELGHRFKLR